MATATNEIDSLKKSTTSRGTCPSCGKRSTKGFIKLDVIAYGEEAKSAKGARHIKSKSRSLCGKCIKEIYPKLAQMFDEEVDQ
jgi:ribosomal protein S27AE